MTSKKASNAIFLIFAIIVAFSNCIAGRYFYILYIFPFLIAQILKGKKSNIAQFFGIFATAFSVLFFQDFYIGVLLFLVTSCFIYTLNLKKTITWLFIGIVSSLVFMASFLLSGLSINRVVHSLIDAGMYFVCASCVYTWNYSYIKDACSKEKPLDQKYIDVLSRLMDIAHESINTLKKIQDDDDGK